jgi:DNA-binding MarR family transcriptional regulator
MEDDPQHNLYAFLLQIEHILSECRDKELKPYGITPEHAAILIAIKFLGKEAIPSEIARKLFRRPHTIFGTLAVMEKRGLVKQTKDLHQKNLVRVSLTAKGKERYKQSLERVSIHYIMSNLSEDERKQLRAILEKIWDRAYAWMENNPE